MFKNFMVAGTLSLGLLGLLALDSGPSRAGVNIDVGIGGGRISCRQGARIVANAGYRRVRPLDCNGSQYSYRGFRRDNMFEISVRSRNGRITNVERIRRGGGGYDDDGDYDDSDY
ncbi:MAG: hypothetical protein AB7P20_21915 [Rhizobiaceae bacterium]